MTRIYFCAYCIDSLPISMYIIFEHLCLTYTHTCSPLEIRVEKDAGKFLRSIRWLENQGYLVSTETALDVIELKPLGFKMLDDDRYESEVFAFCLNKGHLNEKV